MGASGLSFRSITIDLSAIFGAVPLGKKTALPAKDTTTASNGCAVVGPVTSQTTTRSFSITGFRAIGKPVCKSIAQSSRTGSIGAPFRWSRTSGTGYLVSGFLLYSCATLVSRHSTTDHDCEFPGQGNGTALEVGLEPTASSRLAAQGV